MSRRTGVVALVAALGCAVAASAQTAPGNRVSKERPARDRAIQLLRKQIESVDWVDTPFEEIVAWLRAEGDEKVNIVPRWGALSVESVDEDTLVNLQLNNTSVADILNETIGQLSEDGEVHYRAHGNKLTVSTKADFGRKLVLRIYDATDILFRVPDFGQEAPLIDLSQTTGGGGGGGGGGRTVFGTGGGGGGGQTGGEQDEQELEERLQELADIVEAMIEPQTWASGGSGGRGKISIFNQSLLVLNSVEVHEMIAGAFALGG